jgi:hypothetical protein
MTTAQQLIEAGYSRSTANDPGKLAGDPELIAYLNRRYQLRFSLLAAASGDNLLAKTVLTLAGSPASVALPADLIDVVRLENAAGSKVHIVPAEEKDRSWHQTPAVFRQGLSLVSLMRSGDPGVGGVLTLFYLDAAAALTVLASALDARYPARFENLLIVDLALYLSGKDEGRDAGEYKELATEMAREEAAFNLLVYGSATAKERPVPAQTAGKQ